MVNSSPVNVSPPTIQERPKGRIWETDPKWVTWTGRPLWNLQDKGNSSTALDLILISTSILHELEDCVSFLKVSFLFGDNCRFTQGTVTERFPCTLCAVFPSGNMLQNRGTTRILALAQYTNLLQSPPVLLYSSVRVFSFMQFYSVCRFVRPLLHSRYRIMPSWQDSFFTSIFILHSSPSKPWQPLTCPSCHNSVISRILILMESYSI